MRGKGGKKAIFDQKALARRWPRKTGREMEISYIAAINAPTA